MKEYSIFSHGRTDIAEYTELTKAKNKVYQLNLCRIAVGVHLYFARERERVTNSL